MKSKTKTFRTFCEERNTYRDDEAEYDVIISVQEWNAYLRDIQCKQLRVRYYKNDNDFLMLQLLD